MPDHALVTALTAALMAGDPAVGHVIARCTQTLGRPWRWLHPLAKRYVLAFEGQTRPRRRDVVAFLQNDAGLARASSKYRDELGVKQWLAGPNRMRPVAAAESWVVPTIESTAKFARWLSLTAVELDWFADLRSLACKSDSPRLSHYHYRVLAERGGRIRLIEVPKPQLKELQRRILCEILDKIPSHPAAHGFVKGRSIKTFASPHVGRRVVLRMDLQEFFPSIAAARIQALFRTVGYPDTVADALAGVCTNSAPRGLWKPLPDVDVFAMRAARDLYSRRHLPQGAPTSPALANLCAYRADCRLLGLAESAGAAYTRYADDLAFSGPEDFERRADRFLTRVAAILFEEGFQAHHRKTRVMRQGVRQHLAGIVINEILNVRRTDFDQLKAVLTNCVRHGPESQNRDSHPSFRSHLEGLVSFVSMIHSAKGERLRAIFGRIQWT